MLIEVKNLTKIYQKGKIKIPALRGIDLQIQEGEFVAIMGPSGSGKSTLMNLIGCLDKPTSGKYFLDGLEVTKKPDRYLAKIRGRKIGFVFQSFNLLPRYTALANVALPLIYLGWPAKIRHQQARKVLRQVGLEKRISHKANELSGGEAQKVAIARALVTNPLLILADEPTGNLDSHSSQQVMELFKKIHQEGKTIVLVTHEPHIAAYASRIIQLKDGRIIREVKNAEDLGKF